MNNNLNPLRPAIVLVEPQNPGNVGMVCRAMKNMGLSQLRLVRGCPIDHPEATKFAVSAKDVLDKASRFDSLKEALGDVEISIATTRRFGKYRKEIMSSDQVATRLREYPGVASAIVFGREDHGLSTEELSLCRWHATIPTADEYGSLNLAQAVLIFCYELFKGGDAAALTAVKRDLANGEDVEKLYEQMESVLLRIGFLNPQNPAHLMRGLRRIFARAELDSREVSILRGMLSQIDWAANSFEGKKRL